ncbi:NUDIX domain-containing protein [Bacillus sp. Marseille-P3661]|uniref:NUDIX domain-containing protein n=1 Tax=Bacillus sp. Marseille-P3661 TaxID=1936234 RepID=UPI000C85608D|nr:NUDIX domain-containing protein [Bacillus sp. Marseille-P3661]
MFCRRDVYRIDPEKVCDFTSYFEKFIVPNQIKNGAKLIGQWITETESEIITMWEYPSYEDYLRIEERVKRDVIYQRAQSYLKKIGMPYLNTNQDYLTQTGTYNQTPKQNVSVSGYITNDNGETLLVTTYWREDTWELPGGGVDNGETLDKALIREIYEETGLIVKLQGVTGVYSNGNTVSVVFRGVWTGGSLTTSAETKAVRFVKLDSSNVLKYIKRGKFIPRVLDAMNVRCIPYESFKVRPYQLLERLEGRE